MPTVPKDQARVSRSFAQPSDTDWLMAYSVMEAHGKIPSFNERFYGAEPSLPIDVSARGGPVYGQPKAKAEQIPSKESDVLDRESLGVAGGSR